MTWYQFLKLQQLFQYDSTIIYCANPACKDSVIHNTSVIYNNQVQEVYHPGDCAIFAAAYRRPKGERIIMLENHEMVHRETALRLIRRGKRSLGVTLF